MTDGTRWLVGEEELDKRRKRGSLASTVVVRVKGEEVERQLSGAGLWVGGYWCSVKALRGGETKEEGIWVDEGGGYDKGGCGGGVE